MNNKIIESLTESTTRSGNMIERNSITVGELKSIFKEIPDSEKIYIVNPGGKEFGVLKVLQVMPTKEDNRRYIALLIG